MERAIARAMCSQKVADRKTTKKQMDMLGMKETVDSWEKKVKLDGMGMC